MFINLYRRLPISHEFRRYLSSKIPLKFKREKHLRQFGAINDLYPWRTDKGINTIAPIQNFYSALFPNINTSTICHVWFYDVNGNEINQHQFKLEHHGFYELQINQFVPTQSKGTFMWHIKMPDEIARKPEVKDALVYFTDRGYICFEKDKFQPAFIHGIDRYSVFQKTESKQFGYFYLNDTKRKWTAEFPLTEDMQDLTEVILINRASTEKEYQLDVIQSGGSSIFKQSLSIPPRGIGIFEITRDDIKSNGANFSYFSVDGIPTPWGRPAIMRHFNSGAISIMHC